MPQAINTQHMYDDPNVYRIPVEITLWGVQRVLLLVALFKFKEIMRVIKGERDRGLERESERERKGEKERKN